MYLCHFKMPAVRAMLVFAAIVPAMAAPAARFPSGVARAATSPGGWLPGTQPAGWPVRAIDMTAITHDGVCSQYDQATMNRLVGYIPQLHANFASDDVPFDNSSGFSCTPQPLQPYAYMKAWADTIHAAGLHVMFRGNWNHWAGDYGMSKLSFSTSPVIAYESSGGLQAVLSGQDTSSYIGMTYQWILRHPDIFQDGDIFEPFGEPQNNGVADGPQGTSAANCPKGVCQFPSTDAFNQWLGDFEQADQAAFRQIGRKVESGWFGLAGDSYTYVTQQAMAYADTYNMDHFTHDFGNFTSLIQASYNTFGKPIVVEWGDFQDGGAEPETANTTDQYLGWLAQQQGIVGEEYWQLTGHGTGSSEAAVDFASGQMTPAGQVVAKWFGAMTADALSLPSTATPSSTDTTTATVTGTTAQEQDSATATGTATPTVTGSNTASSTATASATGTATPTATSTGTPEPPTSTTVATTAPQIVVPSATPTLSGPAQLEFVQGSARMGTGSSLRSAFPRPIGGGDLLVGVFRAQRGARVVDDRNGAWKEAVSCGVLSIWYSAGAQNGATTVRLSAATSGQMRMALAEYSGVATPDPLVAKRCNQGSRADVTSAWTAEAGAGSLAFAGLGNGSHPVAVRPGSIDGLPAVLRDQLTGIPGTIADEDVTHTVAGRQYASMTVSGGRSWTAAIAVFRHG